jgi:hypothetical protein
MKQGTFHRPGGERSLKNQRFSSSGAPAPETVGHLPTDFWFLFKFSDRDPDSKTNARPTETLGKRWVRVWEKGNPKCCAPPV